MSEDMKQRSVHIVFNDNAVANIDYDLAEIEDGFMWFSLKGEPVAAANMKEVIFMEYDNTEKKEGEV